MTATLPYAFLIAILAYGCTLPGAIDGVKFFFIPDWEKLKDINVSSECPTRNQVRVLLQAYLVVLGYEI